VSREAAQLQAECGLAQGQLAAATAKAEKLGTELKVCGTPGPACTSAR